MSLCVTAGDEGICVSCLAALIVTHGVQGTAMCASSETWGTMGTPRLEAPFRGWCIMVERKGQRTDCLKGCSRRV